MRNVLLWDYPNNIRGNEHREDVVAEFINKSDMFAVDLLNCMLDLRGKFASTAVLAWVIE